MSSCLLFQPFFALKERQSGLSIELRLVHFGAVDIVPTLTSHCPILPTISLIFLLLVYGSPPSPLFSDHFGGAVVRPSASLVLLKPELF